MSVLDVLRQGRDSVIELRKIERFRRILTESMGVRSHNPEYHVKPATGGLFDPMRNVDALLDYDSLHDVHVLQSNVRAAETIVVGAAKASDPVGLSVVRSYYVDGLSLSEIAKGLADDVPSLKELSHDKRNDAVKVAIDETVGQWESLGVARLKEWAKC